MSKIVDFEAHKYDDLEYLKTSIADRLAKIPKRVAEEYVYGINVGINDTLAVRQAVSLYREPLILKHILEKMNETQLRNLSIVIDILRSQEAEKRVQELIDATLGLSSRTQETVERATELTEVLKAMQAQGLTFERLAAEARLFQILGASISLMSEALEERLLSRLSRMPIAELDRLLTLANNLMRT